MLRATERAGVAGKAIEAVQLHKRLLRHALRRRQIGFLKNAYGVLLRVDILAGDVEILIVVEADAHRLGHFVSSLTTTEHRTRAFADADGIAHTEGVLSKHLATLHQ